VVAKREGLLLKPVRNFAYLILMLGILVTAVAVWFASRVSARITLPISNLRYALKVLEREGILHDSRIDLPTDLDELGGLQRSFNEMQAKVRESVHGMLEAKDGEMRATFLALQSQMDPHFLFNMLSVLGIMAEENLNRELTETIGHLTHLLRYSASGSSSFVTLAEEMEYTRRYFLCMKTRFRDDLDFDISLPEEMESLIIPKLLVQPLAENCMKYATNREPPWLIRVEGTLQESMWEITVRDNGPGFAGELVVDMNRILASQKSGGENPGLDLGGMGLKNIAARLFLRFGKEAYCRVGNIEGGGACVAIGGRYSVAG
jgi:two-component system sensor histidine kinase YesM